MSFFFGPLRVRLGRDKNLSVTLFGAVITLPALGAVYWLRCVRVRGEQHARARSRQFSCRKRPQLDALSAMRIGSRGGPPDGHRRARAQDAARAARRPACARRRGRRRDVSGAAARWQAVQVAASFWQCEGNAPRISQPALLAM